MTMAKEKRMLNIKDIPNEVREIIEKRFPYGYEDETIKIKLGNITLHALVIETENITYLIKVNSEKDKVKPQKIEGVDPSRFTPDD